MFALTYLVFTFAWLMYIFSVLLPYYYMGVGNCVKLGLGLGFRVYMEKNDIIACN
jgi:hypothetical protein